MNKFRKSAFTLMETLVTVVILGIVAAILVPNLINRQVENANRTKVKKAMAAYEKAINFIILENDIKSTEELKEFGEEENCKFSKGYFKTVQDGANDCIFKTADRVWWDITDLTNPILILKDSLKDKTKTELQTFARNLSDKTVFALIGRFDDLGTLRINDNAYEQGQINNLANQKYMLKLWYYILQSDSMLSEFDKCKLKNQETCTITVNGVSTTYTKVSIANYSVNNLCNYVDNKLTCPYTSTATAGDYYVAAISDLKTTYKNAKQKCEEQNARLATVGELSTMARNHSIPTNGIQAYWASEINSIDKYNTICAYYVYLSGSGNTNNINATRYDKELVLCIGN